MRTIVAGVIGGLLGATFVSFAVYAWTGPTGTAPAGNVSAPVNIGSSDQVKNAGLSVNALAVFGNGYVQSRLGIANASPSYPLDVTGDIHNTGNVYSAGYFHNSDARLKTNIATISGVDIISRMRGVSFVWKDSGAKSAGVIAQEVEQVMPSAVHTDAQGMKTVEYDQLIAPLIEAVKEQQAEIDELKADLARLKQ